MTLWLSMSARLQQTQLLRKGYPTLVLLLALGLVACGNWGWESIDTDNEERLNIFGLISLDSTTQSFVVVHRTLDTAGPDEEVVGLDTIYYEAWEWFNEDTGLMERDTFWYDPPYVRTLYESKYLVKDAEVVISDGISEYVFERRPQIPSGGDMWWGGGEILMDPAIYRSVDDSFIPQPDTEYSLLITTPAGHRVTGTTRTPNIPQIIESVLPDTLSIRNLFELKWRFNGEYHATVATGRIGEEWDSYICGIDQSGTLEPGDTTWTSSLDPWCLEDRPDEHASAEMGIRLRYIDENYYRYFLATDDETADISNFLIGEGSIGSAYGVDGGFGVFGSFSADWTTRQTRP